MSEYLQHATLGPDDFHNANSCTNHNSVRMVAFMRCHFHANSKAFNAQVKIGADSTLDPDSPSDILVAVIAVIQGPFPITVSLA